MILDELTYEQCVTQGVGPMVFPARLEKGIDPANSTRMKMVCMQNMQQHVKLQHTLSLAWNALVDAGIKPVLLKGAGLAALYPDPQMRPYGDIDLFVGKEQYHHACAVMRNTFPKALKFDEELDHYKHYNLIADGVSIEIHRVSFAMTHPLDVIRYAKIEQFGMTNETLTGLTTNDQLPISIPNPTFNALFVMLHSWEHMCGTGGNLRQICDWKFLLDRYKDDIDASLLYKWLKQLTLLDVWQLYTYIAVNHLGLSQDAALFYNHKVAGRAERLLEHLLNGKLNFSETPKDKHYSNRFVRKWNTMKSRISHADKIAVYSPSYARHMKISIMLNGLSRLFAKDRRWE